jgi:hypothetical protein
LSIPAATSVSIFTTPGYNIHDNYIPTFLHPSHVMTAWSTAALTTLVLLAVIRPPSSKLSVKESHIRKRNMAKLYTFINIVYTIAGSFCLWNLWNSGVWTSSWSILDRAMSSSSSNVFLGYAFGSTQAGYSLWSVLVDVQDARPGKSWTDEQSIMFAHHLFTIASGILVATATLGFRVYAPFFFGVVELSSIPLSYIKVIGKRRHKSLYQGTKMSFAASFFFVRVLLWSYFAFHLGRDLLTTIAMWKQLGLKAIGVPVLGTFPLWILSFMQFRWAVLIFKEVVKRGGNKGER